MTVRAQRLQTILWNLFNKLVIYGIFDENFMLFSIRNTNRRISYAKWKRKNQIKSQREMLLANIPRTNYLNFVMQNNKKNILKCWAIHWWWWCFQSFFLFIECIKNRREKYVEFIKTIRYDKAGRWKNYALIYKYLHGKASLNFFSPKMVKWAVYSDTFKSIWP